MIRGVLEAAYNKSIGALWNWLSKLATTATTRWGAMQLIYAIVVLALLAGFVDAVVLPLPAQYQAQPVFTGTGQQTIPETFIDAMVILMGAAGIYLTYISGRQTTRSRMVNLYLGIAILLITVSVMMGLYLNLTVKG